MDISSEGLEVVFLDQKAPIFCETSSRIGGVFHPCAFAGEKSVGEELCIWGYLPSPLCFSDVYTYAVKNLTLEIKTLETTVFIQCLVMSSSVNVKFHSKFGFIIS